MPTVSGTGPADDRKGLRGPTPGCRSSVGGEMRRAKVGEIHTPAAILIFGSGTSLVATQLGFWRDVKRLSDFEGCRATSRLAGEAGIPGDWMPEATAARVSEAGQ
jgi:hypothetical protein